MFCNGNRYLPWDARGKIRGKGVRRGTIIIARAEISLALSSHELASIKRDMAGNYQETVQLDNMLLE